MLHGINIEVQSETQESKCMSIVPQIDDINHVKSAEITKSKENNLRYITASKSHSSSLSGLIRSSSWNSPFCQRRNRDKYMYNIEG